MTGRRASHLLARLGVALLAVAASLLAADIARGEDLSEPIAHTVGPPGGVGFYVNPSAPGLDAVRVQDVIRRSLERWGNTYLGTTTSVPGAADGENVIGVTALEPGTLGLARTRSRQTETPVASGQTCELGRGLPSDIVRRTNRSRMVTLRRDRVAGGRVRRATVRRRLRVAAYTRTTAPATTRLCVVGDATTRLTPALEFDVSLSPSPRSPNVWTLGPAFPASGQFDFETNALHEIGHVSGLAHQVDECDPSTPMPATQEPTEFWHSPVAPQWLRPGCAAPAPPAPIRGIDSSEPLPGPGATALAGQSILINPTVPPGYDSVRFVSVAERAIRRAGATPAGITDIAPVNGDGATVIGFASLGVATLTTTGRTPRRQVVAAYATKACRPARVRARTPVVLRRFAGAARRDVVATRRRSVRGYRCTSTTRPSQTSALLPELDVRINARTIAWEFGPLFPVDGTRWDLETTILQTLMTAGGVAAGVPCDPATPNSAAGASPGDWWRSAAEVRRDRCVANGPLNAERTRTLRSAGGGAELVLQATGLPYDVQHLP